MPSEDLDDILDEMERDGEPGDVTTGLRRAYARRIRGALAIHDAELVAKFAQMFVATMIKNEEGGDHA